MLFGRREKLPVYQKIKGFIWPRTGFLRSFKYLSHRIARIPGTSRSIAVGFASGAAMSMTPFMGFHFVVSALLAWILRGNILASALGTLVGNPWTFPFIWVWTYRVGCWVLQTDQLNDPLTSMHMADVFQSPVKSLGPLLLPMLVGSIPNAIVLWFITYYPCRKLVEEYKRKRAERRHVRALELIEQRRAREKAHEG